MQIELHSDERRVFPVEIVSMERDRNFDNWSIHIRSCSEDAWIYAVRIVGNRGTSHFERLQTPSLVQGGSLIVLSVSGDFLGGVLAEEYAQDVF